LECPLCSFKNQGGHGTFDDLENDYPTLPGERPFCRERIDHDLVYHCRNCRFTCFMRELRDVFRVGAINPEDRQDPEDIQYTRDVMASFDFSRYHDRYQNKDLPRYLQYEIIRKLYTREFNNEGFDREITGIDCVFFAKINFIIGYGYYHANRHEKAIEAFQRGLTHLDKFSGANNNYLYYLLRGSISYFLGDPIKAIGNYEKGIQLVEKSDWFPDMYDEVNQLDSFFLNSKEVLGPFVEKPFSYLFYIRNIAFVRAFNITFDGYLLGILLFIGLLAGWAYLSKYERRTNSRSPSLIYIFLTFPISLELAIWFFYKFRVHQSLRSVLLVMGTWMLIYRIAGSIIQNRHSGNNNLPAIFSNRFKILYRILLFIPWIMFAIATKLTHFELLRFFWGRMSNGVMYAENLGFIVTSLLFWFPVVIGIYGVHAFFSRLTPKERDGIVYSILTVFCSLVLFLIPVWFMLKTRWKADRNLFYLVISVIWYALFIWFEYKVARPFSMSYSFFRRWSYAYNSRHWILIRILFFFYPACFYVFPQKEHFVRNLAFMFFWPVVAVVLYAMHYGMARLFPESKQKMDYSILITILSLVVMYVAMPLADVSKYYFEDFPVLYIAGGVLWFTLWFQYKKRLERTGESGKVPVFVEYFNNNRLFWVVEFALIWLPVLYIIIWSNTIG
jgi:tetratricopeptide (TPR) repeat protein